MSLEQEPLGSVFALRDWFGKEGVFVLGAEMGFECADGLGVLAWGARLGVWVDSCVGEDLLCKGSD